jgi:hypothetical protein
LIQAHVPIQVHSGGQLEDPLAKSPAGPFFFAVIAVLFFCGAYLMWPPDVFSTPMTYGALIRVIASPVLAALGLQFLFSFAIVMWSDG